MIDNPFKSQMFTSYLTLSLDGTLGNPKSPYAVLYYNNINIIIPYEMLQKLVLDSPYPHDLSVFKLGKDEILTEMRHDMIHCIKLNKESWHRDNPEMCSLNHEWQTIEIRLRKPEWIITTSKVNADYRKK